RARGGRGVVVRERSGQVGRAGHRRDRGTRRCIWAKIVVRLGRGVAQPGRALGSGPRGRRFKSSRPDQFKIEDEVGFLRKSDLVAFWSGNFPLSWPVTRFPTE